jgi:hypothetical protein
MQAGLFRNPQSEDEPIDPSSYDHVETAIGALKQRNNVVPLHEISISPGTNEAYVSLFRFTAGLREYAAGNGTNGRPSVRDYPGSAWAPTLYFDLDSERDLALAQREAIALIERLEGHGIPGDAIRVWFSGMKGFGLEVDAGWFGGFEPNPDIASRIKRLAAELAQECATADDAIYEKLRLMRVPNSRHGKSGLHKIPLTMDELRHLGIEAIKELAGQPRQFTFPNVQPAPVPDLVQLWRRATSETGHAGASDRAPVAGVVDREHVLDGVEEGRRDEALFRYASRLRAQDRPRKEAEVLVLAAARNCQPPFPDDEALRKVDQAYKYPPGSSNGIAYQAADSGIIWLKPTPNGATPVRLTNFAARIVADLVEDDGVETRRQFELEAFLGGRRFQFAVTAAEFAGMGWVTKQLGAGAVLSPGSSLKDHARAAIQVLSDDVPERRVYTHTGWRHFDGQHVYLSGGGGIGVQGIEPDIEVALPRTLSRIALPAPPNADEERAAIRASLGLMEIVPDPIVIPLHAAIWRAIVGGVDFSLHLAGPTGAGKSELAALAQQHFGPAMDARNLAGWSSTANSLELLAFQAKDALLVVDDFAPHGSQYDVQRQHREADRLFRAQGNQAGRGRLRADGTLRPAKPPRGLIVSTGEDVPKGQSLRARLLVLEVGRSDLDWGRLTAAQRDAAAGLFATASAGFVRWHAGRRGDVLLALPEELRTLRERAASAALHRRTPDIVANLAFGMRAFLDYAVDAGAIAASEAGALQERAWTALGESAAAQAHHQAANDPALRFLGLLRAALSSGRAHLANLQSSSRYEKIQGIVDMGKGEAIGWIDGDAVYLEPEASYAAAQHMGQASNDPLVVTPLTLRKRLYERGLLLNVDSGREVLTIRKTIDGRRRAVLHLDAATVLGELAEATGG